MKRLGSITITVALAAGLVLAGCDQGSRSSSGGDTDNVMLSANLSSQFEVPEVTVTNDASGTAMVTLDRNSGHLSGSVTVEGLTGEVTGAHVHEGAAGIAGAVVVGLEQDNSNAMQWNIPADTELNSEDQARLLNGEMYVNVHTAANPAGEIRGQILAEGFSVHRFDLSGANEVPPVETDASGVGYATINHLDQSVVIRANLMDLSGGSAAHIHDGFAGANGGVVSHLETDFAEGFIETSSAVMLEEDDFESLISGGLYVNVHTGSNPDGELRGQITPMNIGVARVELSGDNEVPSVMTAAKGTGYVTFNSETGAVVMNLMTMDLSSPATMAHLHHAFAGDNGPVVIGLEQDISVDSFWSETDTLTSAQLELLIAGELYFNVHTGNFPNGEIRGQVAPEGIVVVRTELSGDQEVPPVAPAGSGIGYTTVNSHTGSIIVNLMTEDLTSAASAAHIHEAPTGENGSVILGLEQNAMDMDQWHAPANSMLDSDGLNAFFAGNLYFNVHTGDNPSGEVRGQIEP